MSLMLSPSPEPVAWGISWSGSATTCCCGANVVVCDLPQHTILHDVELESFGEYGMESMKSEYWECV